MPDAVKALSKAGALRDPETAGFYVGFVAGVLGANPKRGRASGRQNAAAAAGGPMAGRARHRLFGLAGVEEPARAHRGDKLPARRGMIDAYLYGTLPTLDAIELDKSPTFLEQVGEQFGVKPKPPAVSYGRNPELLDTLWGQYFATGQYRPIWRIITCCRGRRNATTASGWRSAARRNTRSPTTPRAIPTCWR